MNKSNNIILSIIIVLLLVIAIVGATFAYFSASTIGNGDNISGQTSNFRVAINIETVKGGNLIPVVDDLIDDTLNSDYVCEDARGYTLCDLYRIRLTNSGDPVTLMGTMKTIYSNYESDNLKFQLFTLSGSTYTEISDMITIDHDTNSQNSFVLEDIAIEFSLTDGNTTNQISDYYLAIWLSDAEYNQLEDQDKVYEGNIMFTSDNGGVVTADFVLGGLSHVSLPRSSSGNEHSDM